MGNTQLQIVSKQHSPDTSNSDKSELISEWIVRFALNAEKALTAKEQAVYLSMWKDGFADLDANRLRAAFVACLRSHTFKTMPTIGDVRKHLQKAESDAGQFEAEQKWKQVLRHIESTSPDYASKQKIGERTMSAIRAAGGIPWIRECPLDQVVWCKKQFIESLRKLAHEGKLPYVQITGRSPMLFDRADLRAWIEREKIRK